MSLQPTRRRYLAGLAGVGSTALAGCSVLGSTRYSLWSRPDDGTDPVELFTWQPASNAFHYSEAGAESMAETLREDGRVESVEIPLVEERPSGESGYLPAYTEVDGTYHRVRVEAAPATLQRWVVWMEPLEELPDGVDYTTTPRQGRSELDEAAIDRAIDRAHSSVLADRDHAAWRASRRGAVFFEPLSPDDSELIPDPPFEYALVEPEGHFGPDELALRLHVEQEAVETTRYTHELEAVADDRESFVDHVDAEHVAAQFDSGSLSEEAQRVLDGATDLSGYDEDAPLSSGFESVLSALNLDGVSVPDGEETVAWLRHYEYDGAYYETRLRVSDDSLVSVRNEE